MSDNGGKKMSRLERLRAEKAQKAAAQEQGREYIGPVRAKKGQTRSGAENDAKVEATLRVFDKAPLEERDVMMTDALNYLLKMMSNDVNGCWTRANTFYLTHGRGAVWLAADSYADFLHSKVAIKYLREDDCLACGHAPLPPVVASYEPSHQAVIFASIGTGDTRLNLVRIKVIDKDAPVDSAAAAAEADAKRRQLIEQLRQLSFTNNQTPPGVPAIDIASDSPAPPSPSPASTLSLTASTPSTSIISSTSTPTVSPASSAESTSSTGVSSSNMGQVSRCSWYQCARERSDSVRLSSCSGCGEVAYCSSDCQKAHWTKHHKRSCKRQHLAAAAPSSSSPSPAAAAAVTAATMSATVSTPPVAAVPTTSSTSSLSSTSTQPNTAATTPAGAPATAPAAAAVSATGKSKKKKK